MIVLSEIVKDISRLKILIANHSIEFFDFGCSQGGAMLWMAKYTGHQGLGFDLSPQKIALADAAGHICTNTNILEIPETRERLVSFVSMFHMLEHLSSRTEAYVYINKACALARDHVIIKQPFFDADQILFVDGFKTYYSHWTGHRNAMTTTDFFHHLQELKEKYVIADFIIGYKQLIPSSSNKAIHSLLSPIDSLAFDKKCYPQKREHYIFPYKVYFEIIVGIDISGQGYGNAFEKLKPDTIAFDSKEIVKIHPKRV